MVNRYHLMHRAVAVIPMLGTLRFSCRRTIYGWQFAAEKEQAQALRDAAKLESFHNDWQYEFHMLNDEERGFYSRKLLNRARGLRVPVPKRYEGSELTSDCEESHLTGDTNLTLEGENKVRAAIREEEKLRSEKWARRIPYLTAITGLIGTLTGLLAVIDRWGR